MSSRIDEQHYDSANIAESYSGIVLPLTCSFASMVYAQVYMDLLAASGISRAKIDRHRSIFENLLAFFYGRMYYHMNSWYRMAEFAPGYTRNKRNFERMITSNVASDVRQSIHPSLAYRLAYPLIILYKALMFDRTCRTFDRQTRAHLEALRQTDFSKHDYAACLSLFERFNQDLLRRWYITVENDFFVMTYLGMLEKLIPKEELQERIRFSSKATEQVDALMRLSAHMKGKPDLWDAVMSDDYGRFEAALEYSPEVRNERESYLRTFGGRFANELKLESVGADEDLGKLFALMRAYADGVKRAVVKAAQLPKLSYLADRALGGFRKYAGRREEFRLLRSNTFAMARRMFKRMGALLVESGAIVQADDVFYLTTDELLREDAPHDQTLRQRVEERKRAYEGYARVAPPAHFSLVEGEEVPLAVPVSALALTGKPASPGKVTGRVRVFREFSMPEQQDFDILVTAHTDPGWTALIALSKGMIIEHGGVLSHASIVARELGIPAVIGATGAMDALTDGQIVTIDGATGSITLT